MTAKWSQKEMEMMMELRSAGATSQMQAHMLNVMFHGGKDVRTKTSCSAALKRITKATPPAPPKPPALPKLKDARPAKTIPSFEDCPIAARPARSRIGAVGAGVVGIGSAARQCVEGM